MRAASLALAALLAVSAGTAAAEPSADLAAVPEPAVGNLEEAVQEQLRASRDRLDELLASSSPPPDELEAAFGETGQLYFLYDLVEPAEACLTNAVRLDPDDFRWPYLLGALHRREGDFAASAEALERARELDPRDVPTLLRLAHARFELGELEAAEAVWKAALELSPLSAAAHHGLGRVAFARGEWERAVELFERTLELQPDATSVHHQLGLAHRELGDLEAARRHLAANRHGPVRFADPLIDDLNRRVVAAQYHFKAGNEAMRRGDLERAVAEYREAVEGDPEYALGRYNLGLALVRSGRPEEAVEAFEAALELDPEYRDAHFNLAMALADLGRPEEAVDHFERTYRIDPQDRAAHLEWAVALGRSGRHAEAIRELEAVLAERPGEARALLHLGASLAETGRLEAAEQRFRQVLAGDAVPATRAQARWQLGVLAERRGDLAAAAEEYRAAVGLDDGLRDAHLALAHALGRSGRYAEAAAAFGEAVRLAPADERAHFGRAMSLLLAGEDREARRRLEEALAGMPRSLPLAHVLARLLATSSEPAVRDGERALEIAFSILESDPTLDHAETVAMALAEVGRFDEAVELQARAVAEARRRGDPGRLALAEEWLAAYRRGEPVRAPWRAER